VYVRVALVAPDLSFAERALATRAADPVLTKAQDAPVSARLRSV